MRIVVAILALIAAIVVFDGAQADPYRWCAQYGGGRTGGSSNCYFVSLQQCQAAVSGVGGFCRPNNFYTGARAHGRRVRRER